MAEWSKAAVLKTVVPKGTGSSNLSPSARNFKELGVVKLAFFVLKLKIVPEDIPLASEPQASNLHH